MDKVAIKLTGHFDGTWGDPTLGLRFLNGRLQQAWAIRGAAEARVEWRDVPDATPAPLPRTRDQ